jgi:cell division protein ZapA (FtsZ GTPase activity inhibitor)
MPSDGVFYTGIDNEPTGIFDNEVNEDTEKLLQEQKRKIKELTPNLQSLVKEVDAEISRLNKISDIPNAIDATSIPELNITAEMAARARQIQFLQSWKTRFTSALDDLKK